MLRADSQDGCARQRVGMPLGLTVNLPAWEWSQRLNHPPSVHADLPPVDEHSLPT